jgi:hypothetical protein
MHEMLPGSYDKKIPKLEQPSRELAAKPGARRSNLAVSFHKVAIRCGGGIQLCRFRLSKEQIRVRYAEQIFTKDKAMMFKTLALTFIASLAWSGTAQAKSQWQPLNHQRSVPIGAIALLTDGTVLLHEEQDSNPQNWYQLTPDNTGSYVNGTIKAIAPLPSAYGPFYFGSAVLPDGRYIIEGGEYNLGMAVWTNLGAIYDPVKNTWTAVNPPSGWSTIGDAQSAILNNGTYMQANCCTKQSALLNARKLSWTATGKNKADGNDEEGWTLLPSGDVLTVDVSNGTNSEIYNPKTGSWSSAGSTIVQLGSSGGIGPAVMLPNGTVFCTGASISDAGHTAIYNTKTGKWSKGPDFPDDLGIADGPGSLEINGKAVVMASPGAFSNPSTFLEWDGSKLTKIKGPPNASIDSSFQGHFLILPTGQLMFTDLSTDVEVFTPKGTYKPAWQPTITSAPSTITRGKSYVIKGTQFNGYSQGSAYGDDFQDATNFALVRVVNNSTKHVFYARTTNPSTMGIQTGSAVVSTNSVLPTTAEAGASTLYVVTNGIPSAGMSVTVK